MTTEVEVFEALQAALIGKTDAGDRVAIPGDLPTQSDQFPILKARVLSEDKQSTGHGSISFLTLLTIRINGEVSEPVDPDDDLYVATIQTKLLALKRQVEIAVINSYPLTQIVQRLVGVQSQFAYTANASRLAGIQCDYTFELYQDADDFAPLLTDEITELQAVDPLHPPVALHIS
ncbi:hypothetical protein [uncultured Sphingomonas sp.]|uniref:hypothetical protein n=1 Tax=uncultured Sphingomonas sp. TaxID=158754 RepID=UPI00259AE7D7|nr:hypothetical protein [uncultured Sphingomonas sp.]